MKINEFAKACRLREDYRGDNSQLDLFPNLDAANDAERPQQSARSDQTTQSPQSSVDSTASQQVRQLPSWQTLDSQTKQAKLIVALYNRNPDYLLRRFFSGSLEGILSYKFYSPEKMADRPKNERPTINEIAVQELAKLDGAFAVPLLIYGPAYGYLKTKEQIADQLRDATSFLCQCILTGTTRRSLSMPWELIPQQFQRSSRTRTHWVTVGDDLPEPEGALPSNHVVLFQIIMSFIDKRSLYDQSMIRSLPGSIVELVQKSLEYKSKYGSSIWDNSIGKELFGVHFQKRVDFNALSKIGPKSTNNTVRARRIKLKEKLKNGGWLSYYLGRWNQILSLNFVQVGSSLWMTSKGPYKKVDEDIQPEEKTEHEIYITDIELLDKSGLIDSQSSQTMNTFYQHVQEILFQEYNDWRSEANAETTDQQLYVTRIISTLVKAIRLIEATLGKIAANTTKDTVVQPSDLADLQSRVINLIQNAFIVDKDTKTKELNFEPAANDPKPDVTSYKRVVQNLQAVEAKIQQYTTDSNGLQVSGPQFVELYRDLYSTINDYGDAFQYELTHESREGDFLFSTLSAIFTDIVVLKIHDRFETVWKNRFKNIVSEPVSEEWRGPSADVVLHDAKNIKVVEFINLLRNITSTISEDDQYLERFITITKNKIDEIERAYETLNNRLFARFERITTKKEEFEKFKAGLKKYLDGIHNSVSSAIKKYEKKRQTESYSYNSDRMLFERGEVPDLETVLKYYEQLTKSLLSSYASGGNKYTPPEFDEPEARAQTQTTTTSDPSRQDDRMQQFRPPVRSSSAPATSVDTPQSSAATPEPRAAAVATPRATTANLYSRLPDNTRSVVDGYIPAQLNPAQKTATQNWVAKTYSKQELVTDQGKPIPPEKIATALKQLFTDSPTRDISTLTVKQLLTLYRSYFERNQRAKPELRWGVDQLKIDSKYLGDNYYLLSLSQEYGNGQYRLDIDNLRILERMFAISIKWYNLKGELRNRGNLQNSLLLTLIDITTLADPARLDDNLEKIRFIYVDVAAKTISLGRDITDVSMRKIDNNRDIDQILNEVYITDAVQKQKIVGVIKMIRGFLDKDDITNLLRYTHTHTDSTGPAAAPKSRPIPQPTT